jgi:hypothetical protein
MDTMGPAGGADQTVTFSRSAARGAIESFGAGCGGVLFLGMAMLFVFGVITDQLVIRIFGSLGFGFFGLLMAAAAISGASRGRDSRVAEVGPGGIWLPELGRLAWSELADVRLERIRGVGSADAPVTRQFRRLGVVPRDPSRKPSGATALAWRLTSTYFSFVRAIAPQARLGGDDAAPFGVSETDIPNDFDRLLEAVGRHVPVVDAADRSARAGTGAVSFLPTDAIPSSPSRSFTAPAARPVEILVAAATTFAPLVVVVPILLPQLAAGGDSSLFAFAFVAFLTAVFVVPGVVRLWRIVRRGREYRAQPVRVRIGPEGLWTPRGGTIGWSDVRDIRTARAGLARQIGGPPIERWSLLVTTGNGSVTSVSSDELEAPFDDVLHAVRRYHQVVETS